MRSMNVGGHLLDLSQPRIMGILNITPDSFYAGSRVASTDDALERVSRMLSEGADMIDIGAYSSRPGAVKLSPEEESARLIPVLREIVNTFPDAILSVDTFRAAVGRQAVDAGAHLINDISGGMLDPDMFDTVAALQVPYILMHMRGTPETMQRMTDYAGGVVQDVSLYFGQRIARLRQLGVRDIILDPGFGFAKTLEQNYELLAGIEQLHCFELPLLGAISRKSMIYKSLDIQADTALNGTTVLNTMLLMKGVKILRVHDVKAAREAVTLHELTVRKKPKAGITG